MEDLKGRYLSVCAKGQQIPKTHLLEALEKNLDSNGVLRLTGNDLKGEERLTDVDLRLLTEILRGNQTVKGLDLRYNTLTDEGAACVSQLVQGAETLQSLDLMGNNIKAKGAEVITEGLKHNKSVKRLRMAGNKIGNHGAKCIANLLRVNGTLEEVDVSDCDLTSQNVMDFALVLRNNEGVRAVNISRPLLFSLQEETTVHMAQMLQVNKTLVELHVAKHGMTDTGMERLCEALKSNFSLRYLDLRCNKITRDGAKCLANVLKKNGSLEILDLSFNRIEDDGAVFLSEAMKLSRSKIKALAICSNGIGKTGLLSVCGVMRVNLRLTHVYIWGNRLDEAVCVAFSQLIGCGRLPERHTDILPYEVDGRIFLAETPHGLNRNYYGTCRNPNNRESSNSAMVLMASEKSPHYMT